MVISLNFHPLENVPPVDKMINSSVITCFFEGIIERFGTIIVARKKCQEIRNGYLER